MDDLTTLEDIIEAQQALQGFVRITDLVPLALPGQGLPGGWLHLKAESLQQTGSFKVRGAYNRMRRMTAEERARGVIASSAGNHAQGVALAARELGIAATIVMPATAPLQKVENTRKLGATVELCGAFYDDAYERALALQKETGAVFIHAFNDRHVIAGQGTIGLEVLTQLPDVQTILVPVGGGGMAAGIALAAKSLRPDIEVLGVEPSGAASMKQSLLRGEVTTLATCSTIADGVAVKTPGDLTFALCQKYLDDILTVDEDEIASAILTMMEQAKMVVEGAGAVAVAGAMHAGGRLNGRRTVAIVSGGNIDVSMVSRIIDRGLVKTGRKAELVARITDRPGQLSRMLECVGAAGANILSIQHERSRSTLPIGQVVVELVLETSGFEHIAEVLRQLADLGIDAVNVTQ